ncbi:MAG: AraC family transcriptional regulator [Bacillota bacterium]
MLEQSEKAILCCEMIKAALLIDAHVHDTAFFHNLSGDTFEVCDYCSVGNCSAHKIGLARAKKQENVCIYFCARGLAFIAGIADKDEQSDSFGIVAGPLVMDEVPDVLSLGENNRFGSAVLKLPVLSNSRIKQVGNVLWYCLKGLASRAEGPARQSEPIEFIYTSSDMENDQSLVDARIFEYEDRLKRAALNNDTSRTQALLNETLGLIYFNSNENVQRIKAGISKLLVILSRVMAACSRSIPDIFDFNSEHIRKLDQMKSMEDVNRWLSEIIHCFLFTIFEPENLKHSDVVQKIKEYVLANFDHRLTLDDISRHVYLSNSYVSSIFKKETGLSIIDYANRVRINRSKRLLHDTDISISMISTRCGFEDQSYFTKTFRKHVGMSPKKYRDSGSNNTQDSDERLD